MARKTKYVRVTVDLILHFEEEGTSLPAGLGEIVPGLCAAVAERIERASTPKPIGWSDGHVRQSLYFPSEKTKKALGSRFKKKAA